MLYPLRHPPPLSHLLATPLVVLVMLLAASLQARPDAADKRHYTVFNPTPAAELRALSADRPDATESPFTVDAGRWQLESDLVARSRQHAQDAHTDTVTTAWLFTTVNLKMGLTHRIDFQVSADPYTRLETDDRAAATSNTLSGFGDLTSRLKINLWGNDAGDTAAALLPYVKLPTARAGLGNDSVEGGLIFPLAFALPSDWRLGVMTQLDLVRNRGDTAYTTEWINSASLSHAITMRFSGYVEITSALTAGRDRATLNTGLTYAFNDDTLFIGLSVRH